MRLAALGSLAGYDAIACVVTAPDLSVRVHNFAEPRRLRAVIEDAADECRRHGEPLQIHTTIQLADGRMSGSLLVAPVDAVDGVSATLVAARSGRTFTASDAVTARHVADLLALELARSRRDRADGRVRREAIALFELARIGLGEGELAERLESMVDLLAASLADDFVQLWLLRQGGSLRLAAAQPRETVALEIARPNDHFALARALEGDPVAVHDQSLRFWLRRSAKHVVVAPLRHTRGVLGLLVVGRWHEPGEPDAERLALICGDFIAGVIANEAWRRGAALNDGASSVRGEGVRIGG